MLDMHMEWDDDFDALLSDAAENMRERLLRSGGNAASEAFQQAAVQKAPEYRGTPPPGSSIKPGQLKRAIYRVYDEDASTEHRAVYAVSWNHKKAPHGWWMENGNSRHPAHPFIRPAWDSEQQAAFLAACERMARRFASLQEGGT